MLANFSSKWRFRDKCIGVVGNRYFEFGVGNFCKIVFWNPVHKSRTLKRIYFAFEVIFTILITAYSKYLNVSMKKEAATGCVL